MQILSVRKSVTLAVGHVIRDPSQLALDEASSVLVTRALGDLRMSRPSLTGSVSVEAGLKCLAAISDGLTN